MENKKNDITKYVYGKVSTPDSLVLYLQNKIIGDLLLEDEKKEYRLLKGFVFENGRIYQDIPSLERND